MRPRAPSTSIEGGFRNSYRRQASGPDGLRLGEAVVFASPIERVAGDPATSRAFRTGKHLGKVSWNVRHRVDCLQRRGLAVRGRAWLGARGTLEGHPHTEPQSASVSGDRRMRNPLRVTIKARSPNNSFRVGDRHRRSVRASVSPAATSPEAMSTVACRKIASPCRKNALTARGDQAHLPSRSQTPTGRCGAQWYRCTDQSSR
jgi:hypothetical protein